ncbi:MAG: amidohydrolase [Clostridiales bacterium]|jgi:5-methylthioadenosine/S-adenosylhomocysteine deaminase|nr:amidohydrolase [Clostridiales bacterium]
MGILIKNIDALPSADGPAALGVDIGIDGDRVAFVQKSGSPLPPGFAAGRTIPGAGRLAIPGLVNAHCHAAMTLLRGYADDMELETWLFDRIFPAEAQLSGDDIYWGTMLGAAEMIKNGVTCFNDMYLKMDSVAEAILGSGIRAAVSVGPLLTGKRGDAGVDADSCKAFFRKWDGAGGGNIRTNMEIHSIYLFQPETLAAGARLAKELGSAIHIHILETAAERENMLREYGKSSVLLAEEYGLLDSPVIAAHCVHVDSAEILRLRDRGASVAHNPSSNLKLASGIAPVPEMLRAGVNVCLGTDGAASNNSLDMFMEMRLAALLHKGASREPAAVPAAQAFRMATRNGALALGFEDCGEIAPGRKADITIVQLDRPHLSPLHSHLSTLVYSARGSDAETVIVNGKVLMENRELLTIDEEKTTHMARAAAKKFIASQ